MLRRWSLLLCTLSASSHGPSSISHSPDQDLLSSVWCRVGHIWRAFCFVKVCSAGDVRPGISNCSSGLFPHPNNNNNSGNRTETNPCSSQQQIGSTFPSNYITLTLMCWSEGFVLCSVGCLWATFLTSSCSHRCFSSIYAGMWRFVIKLLSSNNRKLRYESRVSPLSWAVLWLHSVIVPLKRFYLLILSVQFNAIWEF